ncbi:membrane protein [Gordoniibacillus kamchatkensis]|uniref:Membrane protein n=1 Tax=Gordoniibacillus kamchatkensis TaxID=1590651 RepID=A0ABR5AKM7_9BACL|nr:sporulation membrane protein YtaF [Paenibacillus sp. VKM B-2647]KIL41343.1 membrane protein [Paenibacillus sp. VKM B-2647]
MNGQQLLAVLLIGLASNLDNAGVGLSYGVRNIKIPWFSNLIIAAVSGFFTLLSGMAGSVLTAWLSPVAAHLIGTAVIVFVGVMVLIQPFIGKGSTKSRNSSHLLTRILRNPEEADFDGSRSLNLTESVVLGVALAINALAGGFDAGITNISVVLTSLTVGLFSFGLLGISEFVGKRYVAKRLGSKATVLAGLLLILIGIHQLF